MLEGSDAAPSASLDIFATLHHPWETPEGAGLSPPAPRRSTQPHCLVKQLRGAVENVNHQISLMGNSTLLQPQTPPRFPPAQGGFGGMGWG